MAEINVVPYIDVMLVLLVIFMITAPLLNLGVEVELPKADAEPLDTELSRQHFLVLSVTDAGLTAGKIREMSDYAKPEEAEYTRPLRVAHISSSRIPDHWHGLEMVDAIVHDRKKIMPCCIRLDGEYGVDGLFIGVPVVLGRGGVERVLETSLSEGEKEGLATSVRAVQKVVDEVNGAG